jgi:hypothetical protein
MTMQKRRRVVQSMSLQDRLAAFTKEARKKAKRMPAGLEREAMLNKVRQADVAAHLDEWTNSPGSRPPK